MSSEEADDDVVVPIHTTTNHGRDTVVDGESDEVVSHLKGKKLSSRKLRRYDSLDMESGKLRESTTTNPHHSTKVRTHIVPRT